MVLYDTVNKGKHIPLCGIAVYNAPRARTFLPMPSKRQYGLAVVSNFAVVPIILLFFYYNFTLLAEGK